MISLTLTQAAHKLHIATTTVKVLAEKTLKSMDLKSLSDLFFVMYETDLVTSNFINVNKCVQFEVLILAHLILICCVLVSGYYVIVLCLCFFSFFLNYTVDIE